MAYDALKQNTDFIQNFEHQTFEDCTLAYNECNKRIFSIFTRISRHITKNVNIGQNCKIINISAHFVMHSHKGYRKKSTTIDISAIWYTSQTET